MALEQARHIISKIAVDFFEKKVSEINYKYAGKLKSRPVTEKESVWVIRNSNGGLVDAVAPGASSPVKEQGTYSEMKSDAIHFRQARQFTNEQLHNIISKDSTLRVSEGQHLQFEIQNMMRQAYNTREFVTHQVLFRGALNYSLMGPNQVQINRTFPIYSRTVTTSWSDTTNATVVTDVDTWLQSYEIRVGGRPDSIRMTHNTFNNYVRKNAQVQAVFTNNIQITDSSASIRGGNTGILNPTNVANALGWPTIELVSERFDINFKSKGAVAAGSNVEIPLVGGTFGFSVGDKVLANFVRDADGNTSWNDIGSEPTVTAVSHGKSITVDTLTTALSADQVVAARPTFFPENRIAFVRDEKNVQFLEPPYGILANGSSITLANWRGIRTDAFMQTGEPNLAAFYRVSDAFGIQVQPDNFEEIQVIL